MVSSASINKLCNANVPSVTLSSKYNAIRNASHNTNLSKFLKEAEDFCRIEQRPFCFKDFDYTPGNFRQKIHLLREYIIPVIKGRPTFYKVVDIDFPLECESVTLNPMRSVKLETILLDCKDQPPMIHDIRFKIDSNLHEKLLLKGLTPNKQNNSIVLNNITSPDASLNFKILVYPKHIQLIIGCSLNPIIYDSPGIQNLIFNLGQYISTLKLFVNDTFSIQPISKWMVTHSHVNKDGSMELSGQSFHCTFTDYAGVLYRIYSKSFPNGNRARVETIDTEKKSLADMIKGVIEN